MGLILRQQKWARGMCRLGKREREGSRPRSMITRLKMGDQTILAEETRGLDTANRVQRRGIGSELDKTGPGCRCNSEGDEEDAGCSKTRLLCATLPHVLDPRQGRTSTSVDKRVDERKYRCKERRSRLSAGEARNGSIGRSNLGRPWRAGGQQRREENKRKVGRRASLGRSARGEVR